jgi:hypothetical protein
MFPREQAWSKIHLHIIIETLINLNLFVQNPQLKRLRKESIYPNLIVRSEKWVDIQRLRIN